MRMLKATLLFSLSLIFFSCGSSKTVKRERSAKMNPAESLMALPAEKVQAPDGSSPEDPPSFTRAVFAKGFLGTPYRYGGEDRSGMDCSGLVQKVFQEDQIELPRTSRAMAHRGKKVALRKIASGDLLFFKTSKSHNRINHVGLVVEVAEKNIFFIHSTTSRGVIISSLEEPYWKKTFIMARRIP